MNERRKNLCELCGREWTVLALSWDEYGDGQFYACIECRPAAFKVPAARRVQPRLIGEAS